MGSTSSTAATRTRLQDHWRWRPEWTPERTCLYWYLTFPPREVVDAVGREVLDRVVRTGWLDEVPPRWCHVTMTDVGFTDQIGASDVDAVRDAVAGAVADEGRLPLRLGPVRTYSSAVVLEVAPLHRLRALRSRVRGATTSTLGPRHADVHRRLFWPHVSLGYVNRDVDQDEVRRLLRQVPPVDARVRVDQLTLAAVTRHGRGYRWEVRGRVALPGGRAPQDHR